jgi:hypothetical protein
MRNHWLSIPAVLGLFSCEGEVTPAIIEPIVVPQTFQITLTRSLCFGTCPSYETSITAPGAVQWQGRACVDQTGDETAQRTVAEAAEAFQALIDGDFWSYEDRYVSAEDGCEVWSDGPTAEIRVQAAGRDKTVVHYHGCRGLPELTALAELENDLDRIIGTAPWIGPTRLTCN